ncbi:MAG: mycofactocin precursor MftA [Microthrixaceae bacterium]
MDATKAPRAEDTAAPTSVTEPGAPADEELLEDELLVEEVSIDGMCGVY